MLMARSLALVLAGTGACQSGNATPDASAGGRPAVDAPSGGAGGGGGDSGVLGQSCTSSSGRTGVVVESQSRCEVDDAFCEPRSDGFYCTGAMPLICPPGQVRVGWTSCGPSGGGGGGGAAAVGGGSGPGGAGVAGAGGGIGGAGGAGGVGGASSLPVCAAPAHAVDLNVVGSNGQLVTGSFDDHVVVAAAGRCADAGCPPPSLPDGGTGSLSSEDLRIVLTRSNGASLTLYLKIPHMPADALKTGDEFELSVSASLDPFFVTTVNQTISLVRAGRLIVFAAQLSNFGAPSLPFLDRVGLMLEDGGVVCEEGPDASCRLRQHAVRVTPAAGVSTLVQTGQTVRVGEQLSFTSDRYDDYRSTSGDCDTKSVTRMAGFADNVCSGTAPLCVAGISSCCGDVGANAMCRDDGQWGCPTGSVPTRSCTDFAWRHEGGLCSN